MKKVSVRIITSILTIATLFCIPFSASATTKFYGIKPEIAGEKYPFGIEYQNPAEYTRIHGEKIKCDHPSVRIHLGWTDKQREIFGYYNAKWYDKYHASGSTGEKTSYSRTVYITATGDCYHYNPICGNTKSAKPTTLEQAKQYGLRACENCVL